MKAFFWQGGNYHQLIVIAQRLLKSDCGSPSKSWKILCVFVLGSFRRQSTKTVPPTGNLDQPFLGASEDKTLSLYNVLMSANILLIW